MVASVTGEVKRASPTYYEILKIEETASREEIAAAFRQLALLLHPMRNPQSEQSEFYKKFIKVCEAYKILSDTHMKRIYDKYGDYSLKNGILKGPDKFDGFVNMGDHFQVFEAFFGSKNPFIEEPQPDAVNRPSEYEKIAASERPEDIVVTLECELFEFYNGAIKEVDFCRNQMLSSTRESIVEPVNFMIQVQPGYSEKTEICYQELGNQAFGCKPSNLIVKFKQTLKAGFCRRGDDIVYTHTCSLADALAMKPVTMDTLDGRKVFVTPKDIVSPQTECVVEGEGMPCEPTGCLVADTTTLLEKKLAQRRGNLVVRFNIEFPKRILNAHRHEMVQALQANV